MLSGQQDDDADDDDDSASQCGRVTWGPRFLQARQEAEQKEKAPASEPHNDSLSCNMDNSSAANGSFARKDHSPPWWFLAISGCFESYLMCGFGRLRLRSSSGGTGR